MDISLTRDEVELAAVVCRNAREKLVQGRPVGECRFTDNAIIRIERLETKFRRYVKWPILPDGDLSDIRPPEYLNTI